MIGSAVIATVGLFADAGGRRCRERNRLGDDGIDLAAGESSRQIRVRERLDEVEAGGDVHERASADFFCSKIAERDPLISYRAPEARYFAPFFNGRPDRAV